jgi:hypothetical protein
MNRVAERVVDPKVVTIVGDSKLFSGETLLLARKIGFDFVTLVPKTTNLREDAVSRFAAAEKEGRVEVLLKKESPRTGKQDTWRGCSFDLAQAGFHPVGQVCVGGSAFVRADDGLHPIRDIAGGEGRPCGCRFFKRPGT